CTVSPTALSPSARSAARRRRLPAFLHAPYPQPARLRLQVPGPCHVLVVASGFSMGPDRGTRTGGGLAEPSYEVLVLRYGPTFDFVTKVRPVSVFGGATSPPVRLNRYRYITGRKPCR